METTQEETLVPQKQVKKLTKAGLISIIASSVVVLVAIITTLVLCLSNNTVFLHIDNDTIEYTVKKNSLFSEPTDLPLAEGEIVLGYYQDEEYSNEFNFDTKIKQDTHIYVKTQQLPKQTISFNGNGIDIDIAPVTKYENTKLVLPDLSEYEYELPGYSFSGWAKHYHGNEEYDLIKDDELYFKDQTNIKLYAVWTPVKYTISFIGNNYTVYLKESTTKKISDNETPVLFMEYTINDSITLPTAEKEHSSFLGWNIVQLDSGNWGDFIDQNSLNVGSGKYGNIQIEISIKWDDVRLVFEVDDERKALFSGTDYEYLVSPQSEDDYVYCAVDQGFEMAYKYVDGEKYYVFKEDPTNSSSAYKAPSITGMATATKNKAYWQAENNNGGTTNVKKAGTTQINAFKIDDNNCVTFTPIWATLTITFRFVNPITDEVENPDGTNSKPIMTKYGVSKGTTSVEYGKTYTDDYLPTPVDNETYYEFDGWYTADGTKIETIKWTDLENASMELFTHWKE